MLLDRAKTLRAEQTAAEQRLWYYLRAHRFLGLKFKRQTPIGRYIVDFVCHECHLIVEVDGGQHAEQTEYDSRRDAWLKEQGFKVLQQTEVVLEEIRKSALSPNPSPASGRGE